MAIKTWLQLAIVYVSLSIHFASVTSQYETFVCSTNGSYSRESSYRADLNSLLASLSSNIPDTGFHHSSIGEANAAALCRPDIQLSTCRGCIKIAADDILVQCPDQFEAIIWYAYCMLRYSNQPIFGTLATDPQRILFNKIDNLRSPQVRGMLLDGLRAHAANGGPLVKAAAGNRMAGFNQTIFALVQCTPDLSPENCSSCLAQAAGEIPACCDDSIGVRIYMPSCIIRYEINNFYNLTRLQELMAAAPSLPPFSPFAAGNDGDDKIRNIIIIVVSIVGFLMLAFFVGFFPRKRSMKHKTTEDSKVGSEHVVVEIRTVESIQYDFDKIKAATNNFSHANTLGQGGFGIVYKGKLENGKEIAVKRLSRDLGQGEAEFKNEVVLVARLQHRNLVRLLGFSIQGTERLLVYEFVQNGSLDHFLFDRVNSSTLDWDIRYKIIGGVARGLLYLHEDSRLRIVHRDLKASNVLLDEEMNPKISDFGLAKLLLPHATHQESASRIVGTYGYMAPEYANQGLFSIKSDIYSFGVVVLEIVSGQKRIQNNGTSPRDLLSYAWRNWREGTSANIIDPVLMATPEMLRCIHIALLCVQQNPDDRPTVASVVQMLNTLSSLTLPSPCQSQLYVSPVSGTPISQDHHQVNYSELVPPLG